MANSHRNTALAKQVVALTPVTDGQSASTGRPIRDDVQLSALIGEIYDTTTAPTLWPGVLRKIGDFTGGMAICWHARDASDVRWYACGRTDPNYDRLYLDEYHGMNPARDALNTAEIGKPVGIGDVMDLDEYRASRFYRGWAAPQGVADILILWLDRSTTTHAALVAYRYESNALSDEETRRRALLIGHHLQRAALIGRAVEYRTAEAATLADILDGLRTAVLLVNADGHVVHANAAGEAMLRDGLALRTVSGRLAAIDAQAKPALIEAVAAAKGGDTALGNRGIAVPLTARDGGRYIVHTLPLTSAERRGAYGRGGAVAALFVQEAELPLGSVPEAIASAFQLTPTELRVLLTMVAAGGVAETAEALGISRATVKTHLHRLFGKTDTRRQADLVKLAAGFVSPLAN